MNPGLTIDFKTYTESEEMRDKIQNTTIIISHIEIVSKFDSRNDETLFKAISNHRSHSITTLTLHGMDLTTMNVNEFGVFLELETLIVVCCSLRNDFFHFEKWCPIMKNLTLKFIELEEIFENSAEMYTSKQVKSLTMKIDGNVLDVRDYLQIMDKQCPMLEKFDLEFDFNMEFNARNGCDIPYEPLYFHKLKKLIVNAYGNECQEILNYLRISNKMVNEISIYGMLTDETILDSLCNYKKLQKIKIGTAWVHESELVRLQNLPNLKHLILDVRHMEWYQDGIMEFLEQVSTIRTLVLDHDKRDDEFQFTEEFRRKFDQLLNNGRNIKLTYIVAGREILLSRKGLKEKNHRGGCAVQ